MRFLVAVCAVILVTGCQSTTTRVPPGPPDYQDGWAAGCDSGYVAAGHPYYQWRKDVARFGADKTYAQGWEDGFRTCKGKYEAIQRL